MKNLLSFIVVIILFIFIASLDTVETTSQSDIARAQIQAEINRNSK